MLKKTITYIDYDDNERTEDFYFNLSKAELLEMEWSVEGNFTTVIKKIIAEKKLPELIKLFKDVILKSYGEKSPDGKRFVKSDDLSTAFSQTEAFSNLYLELATNDESASNFVNGVIPYDIATSIKNEK